jgi:hypothetical protein
MKKLALVFGAILIASTCWAHLPVGEVFVAAQFPDANIPVIDGNLIEWDVIPDPYWINHEQLTETVKGVGTAWDATDLALRAIVGWSPTTNKLYVMEDRFDDAIWVITGWEPMEMVFDADHSGGMFNVWPDVEDQDQKDRLHGAQAQNYGYNQGGPGLNHWGKAQWITEPPYGQFANTQTADEGGEGFFRAEYMLTGFNDLDWNGIGTSTIHTLEEGAVTGYHFTIIDDDDLSEDFAGYEGYWTLSGATDSYFQGDLLSDFLLAPIDPDIQWGEQQTAVEANSWGRIKSTFAE